MGVEQGRHLTEASDGRSLCTWAEPSSTATLCDLLTQSPVGGMMGQNQTSRVLVMGHRAQRKALPRENPTNVSITKQMGLSVITLMDFENIMCL